MALRSYLAALRSYLPRGSSNPSRVPCLLVTLPATRLPPRATCQTRAALADDDTGGSGGSGRGRGGGGGEEEAEEEQQQEEEAAGGAAGGIGRSTDGGVSGDDCSDGDGRDGGTSVTSGDVEGDGWVLPRTSGYDHDSDADVRSDGEYSDTGAEQMASPGGYSDDDVESQEASYAQFWEAREAAVTLTAKKLRRSAAGECPEVVKSPEVAKSLDLNNDGNDKAKDGAAASDGDGGDPTVSPTVSLAFSAHPSLSASGQRMSPTTGLINEGFEDMRAKWISLTVGGNATGTLPDRAHPIAPVLPTPPEVASPPLEGPPRPTVNFRKYACSKWYVPACDSGPEVL